LTPFWKTAGVLPVVSWGQQSSRNPDREDVHLIGHCSNAMLDECMEALSLPFFARVPYVLVQPVIDGSSWEASMVAVDHLAKATVLIKLKGGAGVGSGFHFLKPEIIVTNAHVVEHLISSGTEMTAVSEDGQEWTLSHIAHSPTNQFDYAILSATGAKFDGREALTLDEEPVQRGKEILYAGYPHGLEPLLVNPSQVSAPTKDRVFYFGGMIHGGNSGGPITDSTGTKLLGIVTRRRFLGDPAMLEVDKELGGLVAYFDRIKGQGSVSIMGVNFTDFASGLSRIALLTNDLIRQNSTTGIGIGIHVQELAQRARDLKLL
jgi:hypothetical protein